MALTKAVLAEIGGLEAVANNLADDQVLGRLVLARGYKLALAQVVPATTVPEADFASLFRHELRWARTIRALVPVPYAASVLQFSLFWAVLTVLFAGGAVWSWALFLFVLATRYAASRKIDADASPAENRRGVAFLVARFLFHHHLCREFHRQPG